MIISFEAKKKAARIRDIITDAYLCSDLNRFFAAYIGSRSTVSSGEGSRASGVVRTWPRSTRYTRTSIARISVCLAVRTSRAWEELVLSLDQNF